MRPILLAALVACIAGAGGASARVSSADIAPTALFDTGTLVVVIPTADGAVVAADSRGTISDGSINDNEQKIVPSADWPVAAFATGATGASIKDGRSRRTRVDYDVTTLLRREIARLDHTPQADDARRIVETIGEAVRRSLAAADGKLDNRHIVIGLVTFNAEAGRTSVYVGRLNTDAASHVTVDFLPAVERSADKAFMLGVYGEGEYAMAHILRGAGMARLAPETLRLLNSRRTIGQITGPVAFAAARDIIEATGRRMADDHLSQATVGGPTRGVLVGHTGVTAMGE